MLDVLVGDLVPARRGMDLHQHIVIRNPDRLSSLLYYDAFNSADMKTLTELFDERAVWRVPGRSSLAGDHEGREAAFAYFGRLGQETGGHLPGRAAALACRWRPCGGCPPQQGGARRQAAEGCLCLVLQLENGRITEGVEHYRDLYAWDEFWS